jgi:hypothetical protein
MLIPVDDLFCAGFINLTGVVAGVRKQTLQSATRDAILLR